MKPAVILLSFAIAISTAQEKISHTFQHRQNQTKQISALLNINRIAAWYESNGQQERNPSTGNAGVTYPRGTSTTIYAGGILWGGVVHDGVTPELRVNGQMYSAGTKAGAIKGFRTGEVENDTADDVRIWRIRKDYATADLKQDAGEYFEKPLGSVDSNDINAIREQYKKNWAEWPAQKGAPFYDADNDGIYSPQFDSLDGKQIPKLFPDADEPGLQDADQVIWYVANDIAGSSPWSSPDIGLEFQMTLWGYDFPSNHGLGNAIFKRVKLIYKGRADTPDDAKIDSMYIGQWADPDLGDAGDDYAGCDSVLGIGYVYNSITLDKEYKKFNVPVPAFGYILLQGPLAKGNTNQFAQHNFNWKNGYYNQRMTSFFRWSTPIGLCDIILGENANRYYYNLLRGIGPYPYGPPDPPPFINFLTSQPTHFFLSGDPVLNTGWIDGVETPIVDMCSGWQPGDRRILLSSGSFEMAVGDTQEVIFALVGGVGSDRLSSVSVMKYFARQVRENFIYMFPDDPTSVEGKNSSPVSFLLAQNYPNPFNPTTTIKYQLPERGFVSLKVFDALGREIAALINSEKEAGTYSIDWNASCQPSGIYFYRLTSDSFSETKKMILLK